MDTNDPALVDRITQLQNDMQCIIAGQSRIEEELTRLATSLASAKIWQEEPRRVQLSSMKAVDGRPECDDSLAGSSASSADVRNSLLPKATAPDARHFHKSPPVPLDPAPGLPIQVDPPAISEAPKTLSQVPSRDSGASRLSANCASRDSQKSLQSLLPTDSREESGRASARLRMSSASVPSRRVASVISVVDRFLPGNNGSFVSWVSKKASERSKRDSMTSESSNLGRDTTKYATSRTIYDLDKMRADKLFIDNALEGPNAQKKVLPTVQQASSFLEGGGSERVSDGLNSLSNSMTSGSQQWVTPSGTGHSSRGKKSLEGLRAERETATVAHALQRTNTALSLADSAVPRLRLMKRLFKVFGMLPCGHAWCLYRCSVLVILLGLYSTSWFVTDQSVFFYMHLSGMFCALGWFVALVNLQTHHSCLDRLLGGSGNLLETYARRTGFLAEWAEASAGKCKLAFLTWISTLVWWILLDVFLPADCLSERDSTYGGFILSLLSPAVACLLFTLLVYFQLHICCNLELMVDMYCWQFFEDIDWNKAIVEWNKVQSLLRRAADTIDTCFLITQTSVLVAVVLMGTELLLGSGQEEPQCVVAWASSGLPCLGLALYLLYRAAAVSEKCSRVPAFMNGLITDDEDAVDPDRLYLVQYISHSAAGFYVKGVRLSAFIAVKATYLAGVLCFAFVSQTL